MLKMKKISRIKKLLIILIFIIISTLGFNKSFAVDEKYTINNNSVSGSITYNDLASFWYLLCAEHNTHIPSLNDVSKTIKIGDDYVTLSSQNIVDGEKSLSGDYSDSEGNEYTIQTEGNYTLDATKTICTPKAAYILSEATNNTGDYASYVQQAWWSTREGRSWRLYK